MLPGYPALIFLAAIGFNSLRDLLKAKIKNPTWAQRITATLTLLLALTPGYYLHFGFSQIDLWKKDTGKTYYDIARQVAGFASPGGYVGSSEFAGSTRLYTPEVYSFLSVHPSSNQLLEKIFEEGRSAILVVEPWHMQRDTILEILVRFHGEEIMSFPDWGGIKVYRLHKPYTK